MPCFHPMPGWRGRIKNANGKYPVRMGAKGGVPLKDGANSRITIPCGQCHGCRLERSRQWAIRCVHEAKQHEKNCFVTLTVKDEFVRKSNSGLNTLTKRDVQLFIKRLRKKFGKGIRYYYCGEYGDKFGRPHYHLCLFNFEFADQTEAETSGAGHKYYESETLNELWSDPRTKQNYGRANISELNFETAAYVARYITKKLTGKRREEYKDRLPEFTDMSRRPGIGYEWYKKWRVETYNYDNINIRNQEMKPPRYYDKKYEIEYPEDYEKLKENREKIKIDKWDKKGKRHKNMVEYIQALTEEKKCKEKYTNEVMKKQMIRRYENGT